MSSKENKDKMNNSFVKIKQCFCLELDIKFIKRTCLSYKPVGHQELYIPFSKS